MLNADPAEGVVDLDASGHRYVAANEAALRILGVTLQELLASDPDRFSVDERDPEAQSELEAQWNRDGRDAVVGSAPLRRADGRIIRVTYAVEATDTGFRARIRPLDAPTGAPTTMYTVGDVLRQWREAERRLATLVPSTPEWASAEAEIDLLRGRYHELFAGIRPAPDSPA